MKKLINHCMVCYFSILLPRFYAPWVGFVKAVSTVPTQLTLRTKKAENFTILTPATFNSVYVK